MLTKLQAGPFTISGVSVGGVYTSIKVQELDVVFDMGISPRSFVGTSSVFLSHGHADHVGSLAAHIGLCGLAHLPAPRIYLPKELEEDVSEAMRALGRGQRRPLALHYEGMSPGDERQVAGDLWVRAYRTIHSVPSLGYLLFRRVQKLKDEFLSLGPSEIRVRRQTGEELFRVEERPEVAYVTDSLIDVLDQSPELSRARCLILECTFMDERKGRGDARSKYHVHLDEIIERAEMFDCEELVLMHFSQLYSPREVRRIVSQRCPAALLDKVKLLIPEHGPWPG